MFEYKTNQQFRRKTANFASEVYRLDDESTHLFKYMYTLLELGLGQLSTWQDEATDSESLPGTKYTDLDAMFGFLGISRMPSEIYNYDPYIQQLTSWQWDEVHTKDALFRLRIMRFFQALLRGGTLEGIEMMAESASGVQCQVFEVWRVLSGQGLAGNVTLGRQPALNMAKEFVVVPFEDINADQHAAMIYLIDLLKPINTLCTIHTTPALVNEVVAFPGSSSDGYFFEVRKMVTANDDILFQDPDVWIQPNFEVEGPTFAGMGTHDAQWSLNGTITTISAFQEDPDFGVAYGTTVGSLNSSATTVVINEGSTPVAPAFSIMIDSEEVFVSNRQPVVGQDTQYTYTIARAQNGTTAASHLSGANVMSGFVRIPGTKQFLSEEFGPWQNVPTADSADNFPQGKFPGDPSKYDSSGQYIFDYPSQSNYLDWFTQQIEMVGGEVVDSRYRLPTNIDTIAGVTYTPEDALSQVAFTIQPRVFPDGT